MCIYTTHAGMEMRNEERRGMSGKSSAVPTLVPVLLLLLLTAPLLRTAPVVSGEPRLHSCQSVKAKLTCYLLHHFWIRCIGDS